VWTGDGTIVTNAHVAQHDDTRIELWDGRSFSARVNARDHRRDLAVLKISAPNLHPAETGDSSGLRPGELVIAIGNPLGFAGALSSGVVHSIGLIPGMGSQPWISSDVRLAPGNSGGPLADARGRVIGINTAIRNGLGVAVPVNEALSFLRYGPAPRLGIVARPMANGIAILEVEPGSRAEAASLRPGDVLLLTLDALGEALDSGRESLPVAFLRPPGRRVRQTVVRLEARRAVA
jgi:serine protease Do